MFAEEKPYLLPLPAEPFRYYRFGERTVHLDGCVEVEGAYYMAPPGHIGRHVQVQWDELHVRLSSRAPAVCCASICHQQGHYRIKPEDRPARTPVTTLKLLARATPRRRRHRHALRGNPSTRARRRAAAHSGRPGAGETTHRPRRRERLRGCS